MPSWPRAQSRHKSLHARSWKCGNFISYVSLSRSLECDSYEKPIFWNAIIFLARSFSCTHVIREAAWKSSKLRLTLLFRARSPSDDSLTLERCYCCSCCFHSCTVELLTFLFAQNSQFFLFSPCLLMLSLQDYIPQYILCIESQCFASLTLDNSLFLHQITHGFRAILSFNAVLRCSPSEVRLRLN